jgi:hypothetical protein
MFNIIRWLRNLDVIDSLNSQVISLKNRLNELEQTSPKEEYYNNKYPKVDLTYLRHEIDGDYQIDLRDFFMLQDASIPVVNGTDDEKALKGLLWVIDNIKYISDSSTDTYKVNEYWAYSYQTLKHKKGDCEDMSILLANILLKSGVPYWKVRLSAGNVDDGLGNSGGHCFVIYYTEIGDRWVLLDACYYPNRNEILLRKEYKEETYYKDVWFSWNQRYCFSKGLNTEAKKILE